jgi:hypothetical protein
VKWPAEAPVPRWAALPCAVGALVGLVLGVAVDPTFVALTLVACIVVLAFVMVQLVKITKEFDDR